MNQYHIEIVRKSSRGIISMVVKADGKREAAKKVMALKGITWKQCEHVYAKLVRAD